MSTLRDFSPEAVAMSWGGIAFDGYAPDTFITAVRQSDNTTNSVGADGSVGITKNADHTGTIEVTLMQTSPTHRYLSFIQYQQDTNVQELIRANMTISDPSGSFLMRAEGVHIMSTPEISLGGDQNPKTWTFFAEDLRFLDQIGDFAAPAGEASRIQDAYDNIKTISDNLRNSIS